MKMKRKIRVISAVLLAATLIIGIGQPIASAKYFTDIYRGMLSEEFFDAINYVSDNGWMNGTSATTFGPYEPVTRGMFATVLYRYSGSSERYAPGFTDVPSSSYYYNAVGWAAHYGIVNGTTATTFNPKGNITKEQIIVMLYRYAKNYEGRNYTTSSFVSLQDHPDYNNVSAYALEAMRWAKTYNVLGYKADANYLNPTTAMNRAYTSLYVANYAKNVKGFPSTDRFSFNNSSSAFHSIFVLSSSAAERLYNCIDNYYGPTQTALATKDKELIKGKIGENWGGSCFGYSMVLFFDKLGKIDFNKNFGNNAATMSNVGLPKDNIATTECAINYYQLLYSISDFQDNHRQRFTTLLGTAVANLFSYCKDYGSLPFSFFWNKNGETCGHTVILTSITRNSDKTRYELTYIDPNSRNFSAPKASSLIVNGNSLTF